MSTKKIFNVRDKVFAKIRGYPPWPAIISGIKVDTPSRKIYTLYLYGKHVECESEKLFPYEENKSKLGKPNKNKLFAKALLQIEEDVDALVLSKNDTHEPAQEFIAPNNTSTPKQESKTTNELDKVSEIEKINKSNSETGEKFTVDKSNVSKGKTFFSNKKSLKTSDVKPEELSKKSVINKIQVPENLSPKDNPSIELEKTLKSSTLAKASGQKQHSDNKIKHKKYSNNQNSSEVPKSSKFNKVNSESSEKQKNSVSGSITSLDQNDKTKKCNSNSITPNTSKNRENHAASSAPYIKDSLVRGLEILISLICKEKELPNALKDRMMNNISYLTTYRKKTESNKKTKVELLFIEHDLLNHIQSLVIVLDKNYIHYEKALHYFRQISKLQLNAIMLKKNEEVVAIIKKFTDYDGDFNYRTKGLDTMENTKKVTEIRRQAEIIYNTFISLFTVLEGQTFPEVFQKEIRDFRAKTKHLTWKQFYEITSDTFDD